MLWAGWAAPCCSVFSLLGCVHLHSTDFSVLQLSWVHIQRLLFQDILFVKMCCFHRLHLFSRIPPKDKLLEGTKPASQVQFPWEMQAGISLPAAQSIRSIPLFCSVPRNIQFLQQRRAVVSRAARLQLSSLQRGFKTTSQTPLCQNRPEVADFLDKQSGLIFSSFLFLKMLILCYH